MRHHPPLTVAVPLAAASGAAAMIPLPARAGAAPDIVTFALTVAPTLAGIGESRRVVTVTVLVCSCAEQFAVVPLLLPAQVQLHGPDPETELAVPALHRFVGAADKVCPLSLPHTPFTAAPTTLSAALPVLGS